MGKAKPAHSCSTPSHPRGHGAFRAFAHPTLVHGAITSTSNEPGKRGIPPPPGGVAAAPPPSPLVWGAIDTSNGWQNAAWHDAAWWWLYHPDWVRSHHPEWWGDFHDGTWYPAAWWWKNAPDFTRLNHPEWWGDYYQGV